MYTNEAREEPDLTATPEGMSAVHSNPLLAAAEPDQAPGFPDPAALQHSPAGMSVFQNPVHEGTSPGALSSLRFGSPVHGGMSPGALSSVRFGSPCFGAEEPASPSTLPARIGGGDAQGADELWHDATDAATPEREP